MSVVHPVVFNPILNPIVGITNMPAWRAGQDFHASLALLWPVRPSLTGIRKSAVGPDPLWSYTGPQYDADGAFVGQQTPVFNATTMRWEWGGAQYTNMLQNSEFVGAVSGTPGTAPTGWTFPVSGGVFVNNLDASLTFTTSANRHFIELSRSFEANSTYYLSFDGIFDGSLHIGACTVSAVPSGTAAFILEGVSVTGLTAPSAGYHRVTVILTTTIATPCLIRFGVGTGGASTGTVTISNPILTTIPNAPYIASPVGGTTTVYTAAVPALHGDKGAWWGPGYSNLFAGNSSIARSVTLTAQNYTLTCDTGSVTCSYGTATPSTPLVFTATAGSTTFTPTGVTKWQLTASVAPMPYVPPGTTVASAAGTNGGNGMAWEMDKKILEALRGKPDGVELWDNAGASGTNWALVSGAWTHTAGSAVDLVLPSIVTIGQRYLARYTITGRTAGSVTAKAGSSGTGGATNAANGTFAEEGICVGSTSFIFTPSSDFNGTVTIHSIQKLLPAKCTVAAVVTMGAGSANLANGTTVNVLSHKNYQDGILYARKGSAGQNIPAFTSDGNSFQPSPESTWSILEKHLKVMQVRTSGPQFRVGNKRLGIDSTIQWGSWATFDGSFNPLTHLCGAFTSPAPIWGKGIQVWDEAEVSEKRIEAAFKLAGVM